MAEGTNRSARRIAVAIAAALAFTAGGVAFAQPGPHHGGMGDGADMIGRVIAHAKSQLNLNTSQQAQFDAIVTQTKGAMQTGRANMQQVKDALAAELAKPEPDLAAVAAIADSVHAQNQALHKQVRDQWLSLYATFSPDQKAVVKQMIQNRMARAEQFRQNMRERFLNGQAGTN